MKMLYCWTEIGQFLVGNCPVNKFTIIDCRQKSQTIILEYI